MLSAATGAPVFDNRTIRVCCLTLIAAYAVLLLAAARQGYRPHPGDTSMFWAAGRLALAGRASAAYDWASVRQLEPFPSGVDQFYYPPIFLVLLAPLSLLPYAAAAVLWLGATLAAYLAAIRAILPGPTALLAALASPLMLFNAVSGQNGLLTAGLLGLGLALLDAAPVAAGMAIGLLAYKPHFGVLLPLFLALTGRWRVFASAALTVSALTAVAAAMFGRDSFAAFAEALPRALGCTDLQSVYGLLRMLAGTGAAAWAGHIGVAAAAAFAALWLATAAVSASLQAAALAIAIFLVPPYTDLSDLAVLMVPLALLLRDGMRDGLPRWEKGALVLVFVLPIAWVLLAAGLGGDTAGAWLAGLGPVMCGLLAAVVGWRARDALADAGRRAEA